MRSVPSQNPCSDVDADRRLRQDVVMIVFRAFYTASLGGQGTVMLLKNVWALLAVALLAVACKADVPNPSGSCKAPNDGGRAGYHSALGTQWLPNCQNPLRKEYWRVFATSRTSAATIPRLDGNPGLKPACADPQHELATLVQRYALCSSAATSQAIARVNDMSPADALELTRFLHHRLRFVVVSEGIGVFPWPVPTDIIDACGLHPQMNSSDLTAICKRESARLRSGREIGFSYQGPGAVELVTRLNELYGIM